MREGTIEDAELDAESCEVITLWHVLEHLREPVAHLHRLARVLSDGGVLAVEVPNAGSAVAERLGASWPSRMCMSTSSRRSASAWRWSVQGLKCSICTQWRSPPT